MHDSPAGYSVRPCSPDDLPRLQEIFSRARDFMRAHGNTTQWNHTYPDTAMLSRDIERGQLYALCDGPVVAGVFALIPGDDPTYAEIEGAWGWDEPYAAIHRVAGDGEHRGIVAAAVASARERYDYLRIDTHEDNVPMRGALAKEGFTCRGLIYLEDGAPRFAFDWHA